VSAGKPVKIGFLARAVVPDGVKVMKPITRTDTPAHLALKRFRRGINLGNDLEAPKDNGWGIRHDVRDLNRIRAEGFDHVRIPVRWHEYTGPAPDFALDPSVLARVDSLIDGALERGLAVLLNVHHFDPFTDHPERERPRLLAIWKQLAERYRDRSDQLAFELLNEPRDRATTALMNDVHDELISIVRRRNPKRILFVGPGNYNSISELAGLRLPDGDDRIIVTVHSYDPFPLTHQGANWISDPFWSKVTGVVFPGPPTRPLDVPPGVAVTPSARAFLDAYHSRRGPENPCSPEAVRARLAEAAEWSKALGRPVHLGEFGCYSTADRVSRVNYVRAVRVACEELDLGWCHWEWKAGYRYFDANAGGPVEGMREALFGPNR
jgi:endoglucanase